MLMIKVNFFLNINKIFNTTSIFKHPFFSDLNCYSLSSFSFNRNMESLPKTPIIQHMPDTLEQVRKMFALNKPEVLKESIDILQDWASKQPHFNKKDFDRDYLEGFIIRAKGSVEKAKKRLDTMCTLRTLYPHLYEVTKMNELINVKTVYEFILPKQTKDYCTIYFIKNSEKNYGEAFALNYYKRMTYLIEFLYNYDYGTGVIYVVDLREAEIIKNITELVNPFVRQLATQATKSMGKAYGARLCGAHFLTDSNAMETFLSILRPLVSKVERIFVHKNLESLYKHVDKDLLPKDYGGKEESSDVLYEKMMNFLSSDEMLKNMEKMSNATIDTKIKKVDEEFETDMGVPGSFRKLTVD